MSSVVQCKYKGRSTTNFFLLSVQHINPCGKTYPLSHNEEIENISCLFHIHPPHDKELEKKSNGLAPWTKKYDHYHNPLMIIRFNCI